MGCSNQRSKQEINGIVETSGQYAAETTYPKSQPQTLISFALPFATKNKMYNKWRVMSNSFDDFRCFRLR